MNLNIEPIKDWFGFSRRERTSNFTLLIIIMIFFGIRYIIPASTIEIEDMTSAALASDYQTGIMPNDSQARSAGAYKQSRRKPLYSSSKNNSALKSGRFNESSVSYQKPGSNQYQKKKIDINNSDSASLVSLPGIGPVLSARIIKYRNMLGGFASTDQLKEVYGLSEETFNLIKDRVTADTAFIKKLNINTTGYKEISHIRYLEKYEITSILKYRELNGRIRSMKELTDNKILTAEKAAKVEGYLKFDE